MNDTVAEGVDSEGNTMLATMQRAVSEPSLALCLVEAMHANVAEPAQTAAVVECYHAYRQAKGHSAMTDGVRALLRTFEEVGGIEAWAGKVGNYRRRYSPNSSPVAAAAIEHAAELLYRSGIESSADLRRAVADAETARSLEARLGDIAGSPAVWDALLSRALVNA